MFEPSPFDTIPVEVDLVPEDRGEQQTGLRNNAMGGNEMPRAREITEPARLESSDPTGPYEGGGPAGRLQDHPAGDMAEPDGVPGLPDVAPVRRSNRVTKGVTSRYKDFVE